MNFLERKFCLHQGISWLICLWPPFEWGRRVAVLVALSVAQSCGPASHMQSCQREMGHCWHSPTACWVLYTDPSLLVCPVTDMTVSEILQHTGHAKSLTPVCLFVWVFCHHTPWGESVFLIPLGSTFQETSETLTLSRKFSHAEKLVCQCRYRFAHASVQRWHYPWIFIVSF